MIEALPFWSMMRTKSSIQAALKRINASVVGILLIALYDSVLRQELRSCRLCNCDNCLYNVSLF